MSRIMMIAALLVLVGTDTAWSQDAADQARIDRGRQIAFERTKGNCLACHVIEDGELAGNYGPPLVMMKVRFPDRDDLRTQISDPLKKNADTRMPPFGVHKILTDEEIDLVVDFVLTL